jgi:hypothetical protein
MTPSPEFAAPTVFVIRMWLERSASGDAPRGYVEHVATGSRRYFCAIDEVVDFIQVLATPAPHRSAAERRGSDADGR